MWTGRKKFKKQIESLQATVHYSYPHMAALVQSVVTCKVHLLGTLDGFTH
jgi:hypothetical protein